MRKIIPTAIAMKSFTALMRTSQATDGLSAAVSATEEMKSMPTMGATCG
jgi:hypothetical protein